MRTKFVFILFLMASNTRIFPQSFNQYPQKDFIPPFAGELQIIGTFCELRPNHFHGGLDIRTDGKIGRHVLAIGDGFVSRINISTSGYGKALYISHPNGYTSVYAHLSDFPESIKWYIEKNQYLQQVFELELYPEPDLLLVKKGQLVAYSGNTGSSQGPHLHFEIRDTKTEAPVNPLLFGIIMPDHKSPAILNVYLYRRDTLEKLHSGHYPSVNLPLFFTKVVKKGKKKRKIQIPVESHTVAFGKYALGANLKDYALSAGDNNGVNYIKVYRNGTLFYDCRIEKFMFSQMRMHNNYIDFRRERQTGIKMHKLFKDDGSTLDFWTHSPESGWFEISDTIPVVFRIVAGDVYGNTSEKRIILRGDAQGRIIREYINYYKQTKICYAKSDNKVDIGPDFSFVLPKNALYSDYLVNFTKNNAYNYTIGNTLVPLDKRMELHFKLNPGQLRLASKMTICSSDGRTYGGVLRGKDILVAEVREFGTFYLVIDTIRPSIKPIALNKKGYFSFTVADNFSGIKDFDFYIDSVWVLLEYESKSALIYGRIPTVLRSGEHSIQLIVRDNRLNERIFLKTIKAP